MHHHIQILKNCLQKKKPQKNNNKQNVHEIKYTLTTPSIQVSVEKSLSRERMHMAFCFGTMVSFSLRGTIFTNVLALFVKSESDSVITVEYRPESSCFLSFLLLSSTVGMSLDFSIDASPYKFSYLNFR